MEINELIKSLLIDKFRLNEIKLTNEEKKFKKKGQNKQINKKKDLGLIKQILYPVI